ncbi:proline-rich receptor-like protein kinase PERK9 [Rhododendron vialii]|uniref:proline-rich receptor-like protein kinase PERK9 n=1 Tax=Rhododendron vialii TaxID=182163 RepID=UPI00265FEFE0|nr:proline-rich receptor-like protein kinase PERK9 [Rhododendron vialii]
MGPGPNQEPKQTLSPKIFRSLESKTTFAATTQPPPPSQAATNNQTPTLPPQPNHQPKPPPTPPPTHPPTTGPPTPPPIDLPYQTKQSTQIQTRREPHEQLDPEENRRGASDLVLTNGKGNQRLSTSICQSRIAVALPDEADHRPTTTTPSLHDQPPVEKIHLAAKQTPRTSSDKDEAVTKNT